MFRSLLLSLIVILPVALLSGGIVFARIERIAEPEKIIEKGLEAVRREDSRGFGMLALMFGLVASAIYAGIRSRPFATPLFLGLGLGLALMFSLAAAIVRPRFGLSGVPEVIALNFLWGLGYGWLMPLVQRMLG